MKWQDPIPLGLLSAVDTLHHTGLMPIVQLGQTMGHAYKRQMLLGMWAMGHEPAGCTRATSGNNIVGRHSGSELRYCWIVKQDSFSLLRN